MNRKQYKDIKDSIKICTQKLRTIKPHLTDEKYTLNESFNKLLIEKAILRDKLINKSPSFISGLIKKIGINKKEFICDYFK